MNGEDIFSRLQNVAEREKGQIHFIFCLFGIIFLYNSPLNLVMMRLSYPNVLWKLYIHIIL